MIRKFRMAMLLALVIAACGGGAGADETTTTAEPETTTTGDADTTTTRQSGGSIGLNDIPQECIDIFVEFLQTIEPALEAIDWENATSNDLAGLSEAIDPDSSTYEQDLTNAGCDDLDVNVDASDEEGLQFMIDLAEDHAPGVVPYFEWIREFAVGTGQEASGDCDTDIATIDALIAEGGTMQDLSIGELTYVGSLMTSVGTNCSPEKSSAFFERAEVQAFLGSGG